MLMNLFKNDGQDRVFDSIIIITDRKVLDKQLQDTVKSIQRVEGVVKRIDKNSEQLRKSLTSGKNIIVTPHIGGMTIEGQTKAYKWSINKL